MKRVDKIVENEEFKSAVGKIEEMEKDRIYCKHGISHLLDTARIAYIISLERGLLLDKEIIYATALLHDIGRSVSDVDHEKESVKIAIHILGICGFSAEETDMIATAIERHRKKDGLERIESKETTADEEALFDIIMRADKLSRVCKYCNAKSSCKWTQLNTEIMY